MKRKIKKLFLKNRSLLIKVSSLLMLILIVNLLFKNSKVVHADSLFSLDEGYGNSVNDSNGTVSTGTITGAIWITDDLCKNEKCLYFDGTQDYVSFPDDTDLDFSATSDFTVFGWFRHAPKTSGTDILVSKMNSSDNDGGYQIQMESDGDITCEIDDDDADTTIDDSATSTAATYDDNQWHQFACVKSGTTSLTLYIDGAQVAQDASIAQSTTIANNDPFTIGIDGDVTSNDYTGFIDEVKVVRSAKTATEIKADYLGSATTFTGNAPVGWWKMDESSANTCTGGVNDSCDSSGNGLDGAWTGNTSSTTGKFGNAVTLDGTNDYISVADNTILEPSTVTLMAWVYPNASTFDTIATKRYSPSSDPWNSYTIEIEGSGFYRFCISSGSPGSYVCVTSTTATASRWDHVVGTYDGTIIKIYVNGILEASQSTTITIGYSAEEFRIGEDFGTNDYSGEIDEIKVYNYARSATQILEDMVASPPSGVSASFGPDTSYLSNGLTAYWKMEEAGDATRIDASGNGNSLAESASDTVAQGLGKFGYAADFELADTEYLEISDNESISAGNIDMTITAWVNAESIDPGNNMILWKGGVPNSTREYHIQIDGANDWRFGWNPGGGASSVEIANTTTSTTGVWYFIAAYHNSQNGEVGLSINNGPFSTGTVVGGNDSTASLRIGADQNGATNWDGLIDSVRIYKRLLSPAEISKLYNWAPGPVGYWKMDESSWTNNCSTDTVYDSSGNGNNGDACPSSTGPTGGIAGKYGNGGSFDGTEDAIAIPDSTSLDIAGSFTVSTWFKASTITPTNWDYLIIKDGNAGGQESNYHMDVENTGDIECGFYGGGSYVGTATPAGTITANTWYHAACVFDTLSNTLKIYINGVELANATITAEPTVNTANVEIGGWRTGNNYYFPGLIDDVRIYNYARTPLQVIEDMNAGHPAPGSPIGSSVAHWSFDEGYSTTAYDSSINANNLTLNTASWTNNGKFGKAWSGNGGDFRLSRTTDPDLEFGAAESFTLSAWFKTDSATNPTKNEYIINDGAAAGSAGYSVYVNASGGQICFGIDDDTTWTPDAGICATDDYYDNTWHHVTAVRNTTSDTIKIYIDGMEKSSTTDTTTATLDSSPTFFIGDIDAVDDASGEEFAGDIDEIQIFRSALTDENIKQLYNQASMAVMGASSTDASNNPTWSAENEYCPPGQGSTCTGPIAHWKMDENRDNTCFGGTNDICDISGNGNDGAKTNMDSSNWATGKMGSSINFFSSTINDFDYLNFGTPSTFANLPAITVTAWIYPRNEGGNDEGKIVCNGGGGTSCISTGGWHFGESAVPIRGLNFSVDYNGANNLTRNTSNSFYNFNAWQFVAVTWDGSATATNVHIYRNGVEATYQTTTNGEGSRVDDDATTMLVGAATTTGNRGWDGMIDDVRIYNYVRTPAQIAWDYNRGGPVVHWQMDETSWNGTASEVKDTSGNVLHGVRSGNATTATGKINNAGTFDGTDDNVRITESTQIDIGTTTDSYSITGWVKTSQDVSGGTYAILAGKRASSVSYPFMVYLDASEILCFEIGDGTNYPVVCSPNTLNDNTWHHFAAVRNTISDTINLYIDGILISSSTDSTTATTVNNDDVSLGNGGTSYTQRDYNGYLDDIRIYNYPITVQQVKTIINDNSAVRFAPETGSP